MKAVIIGLCFFAVGIGILGSGINSLIKDNRAASWPTTEGTITSSKCVRYYDMEGSIISWSYFTHVNYRYTVEGNSYPGDRIAFGYSGSCWKRPNQKIADRLSLAKTVIVRYDPGKPSMAVLSCGLNGSTVRTMFIGIWIMIMTAAVLLHVFRSRNTTGLIGVSWGSSPFRVMVQGVGGIVLLGAAGLVIASLLGFVIDLGILSTIVTG